MADMPKISFTTLPLATALDLITAGVDKATSLGVPSTITVIDAGGNLVAAHRMDGAALASIETSHSKARTALYFAQPTRDLAGAVQPGAPLFTIDVSVTSPLAFVPGGIPLHGPDGVQIGAVGAGGGSPDQDHEVAVAAAGTVEAR